MPMRLCDELGRCWPSVPEGWGAAGRKLRGACSGVICYPPGELCTPDTISTRTNSRALTEWSCTSRQASWCCHYRHRTDHACLARRNPSSTVGFFWQGGTAPALSGHAWQPLVFVATKVSLFCRDKQIFVATKVHQVHQCGDFVFKKNLRTTCIHPLQYSFHTHPDFLA